MAKTATKGKAAKAKAAEPVEEVEDLELDDLDEDEDEEVDEAPAPKKSKAKKERKARSDDVAFGARQLAEHLSEQTGKTYDPRAVRVLLRKMVKEGRLSRTQDQARERYSWTGPDDPEVKKILKAVKSGEIEKGRQEALEALKEKSAAKREAKRAEKAKAEKKAKKAAPVEDDDDDDDDLLEEDDD